MNSAKRMMIGIGTPISQSSMPLPKPMRTSWIELPGKCRRNNKVPRQMRAPARREPTRKTFGAFFARADSVRSSAFTVAELGARAQKVVLRVTRTESYRFFLEGNFSFLATSTGLASRAALKRAVFARSASACA